MHVSAGAGRGKSHQIQLVLGLQVNFQPSMAAKTELRHSAYALDL